MTRRREPAVLRVLKSWNCRGRADKWEGPRLFRQFKQGKEAWCRNRRRANGVIFKPVSGAAAFWHLSVAFGGNTKQNDAVVSVTGAQSLRGLWQCSHGNPVKNDAQVFECNNPSLGKSKRNADVWWKRDHRLHRQQKETWATRYWTPKSTF